MVFPVNQATFERTLDKVEEGLLRPLRFREGIGVAGNLNKVTIDSLLSPARVLNPQHFRLFAPGHVVSVPGVIQVAGRNATKKEDVVRLGRQGQAKSLNLPARKKAHRQI